MQCTYCFLQQRLWLAVTLSGEVVDPCVVDGGISSIGQVDVNGIGRVHGVKRLIVRLRQFRQYFSRVVGPRPPDRRR